MIPEFTGNMPDDRKEYKSLPSFIKAFKEQIKNFDETKLFFAKKGKYKVAISFVVNGKLVVKELSKYLFEIREYKGHFEYFLETGVWDEYVYYRFYDTVEKKKEEIRPLEYHLKYISVPVYDKVYAVKSENAQFDFLYKVRGEIGDCGMSEVSRPDNNDDVVFID